MPKKGRKTRSKPTPKVATVAEGWLSNEQVAEMAKANSGLFKKCCIRRGIDIQVSKCACAPDEPLCFHYDETYDGEPVLNERYAFREYVGAWKTVLRPVFMKDGSIEHCSKIAMIAARLECDPDRVWQGKAMIVRNRSVMWERNHWKDDDGSTPDLVFGPRFLRLERSRIEPLVEDSELPKMKQCSENCVPTGQDECNKP